MINMKHNYELIFHILHIHHIHIRDILYNNI